MSKRSQTPTRLVAEPRQEIPIVEPSRPSRFRSLGVLSTFARLLGAVLLLRLRRRYSAAAVGRLLRERIEELGGLWIKAGQLVALRIDIFPTAVCEELAKLQNQSVGFPTPVARRIIEEELGAPLESVFDEFEDRPFAAASIGQLYRARLAHERTWVAVKVLRPYVEDAFARDLVFIQRIAWILERLRVAPAMRWSEGLWELRQIMRDEVDYRFEAAAQRQMRKTLRHHKIFVPRVFDQYSKRRVLVTEFLHGILMSDYIKVAQSDPSRLQEWLAENDVKPRRVARRLISSMLRQLFEDNLYHGDLHPGNIVLLRDSRVALIDFGTCSFTEQEYLMKFRLFIKALATRDYAKAADMCFLLCAVLPVIDVEPVKERIIRALRAWAMRTSVKELPYHQKSIDSATVEVTRILFEENCTMEWMFLRVRRALTTLDSSLILLFPDVNYTKVVQTYLRRAERRALERMASREMAARALGSIATGMDIQERFNEYSMFQGSIIRQHAQVFEGASNRFASSFAVLVAQLSVLMLALGVVVLVVLIQQHLGAPLSLLGPQASGLAAAFPTLDPQVWLGILAVDLYVVWNLRRVKARLEQKDFRNQRVASV